MALLGCSKTAPPPAPAHHAPPPPVIHATQARVEDAGSWTDVHVERAQAPAIYVCQILLKSLVGRVTRPCAFTPLPPPPRMASAWLVDLVANDPGPPKGTATRVTPHVDRASCEEALAVLEAPARQRHMDQIAGQVARLEEQRRIIAEGEAKVCASAPGSEHCVELVHRREKLENAQRAAKERPFRSTRRCVAR